MMPFLYERILPKPAGVHEIDPRRVERYEETCSSGCNFARGPRPTCCCGCRKPGFPASCSFVAFLHIFIESDISPKALFFQKIPQSWFLHYWVVLPNKRLNFIFLGLFPHDDGSHGFSLWSFCLLRQSGWPAGRTDWEPSSGFYSWSCRKDRDCRPSCKEWLVFAGPWSEE